MSSSQEFRLIVAGGRDFTDVDRIVQEVYGLMVNELKDFEIVIVQGEARGADKSAKIAAQRLKLKCESFPAEWDLHGKAAGPIRNRAMAEVADGLLAFWDGESKGTANMIQVMRTHGKNVRVRSY
ncbi:hypothetical protein HWB52_gp59 [Pseudomonas phage Littlefix]|uniref:YspA cpYpsA-related SLOG domain-containing protein n=1 Tax=Pseudomonas phage Littlefix TaxID=2079289 RepID=A0A2K9VHQ2_9CAUD|nr:hypothetical protein HWB52_gp59 [Pseudomonas phage Littlefix]AUV61874.1 hypothetical protein PsPhLittlefix_gp59 [Pseudomonas phage Littlefix]